MPSSPRTPQDEIREGVQAHLKSVLETKSQEQSFTGKALRGLLEEPPEAGLKAYLRDAFLYPANILALVAVGGVATILFPPAVPLVMAAELAYLGGMVSLPKFRTAVDRRYWQKHRAQAQQHAATQQPTAPARPLSEILKTLSTASQLRFDNLRKACVDMRNIARDVRGTTGSNTDADMERLLTGDLDRLLWTFLRYLIVQEALERFQDSTDEGALQDQIAELEQRIASLPEPKNERMVRALTDSLATAHQRLENYQQAHQNHEFVLVELDRIEGKIRAITEMTVNRQDPTFISSQVDSVVQSMKLTEQTISELSLVSGLTEDSYDTPVILEAS